MIKFLKNYKFPFFYFFFNIFFIEIFDFVIKKKATFS